MQQPLHSLNAREKERVMQVLRQLEKKFPSVADLCEALGFGRTALHPILRGNRPPGTLVAIQVAEYLGRDPADFLDAEHAAAWIARHGSRKPRHQQKASPTPAANGAPREAVASESRTVDARIAALRADNQRLRDFIIDELVLRRGEANGGMP